MSKPILTFALSDDGNSVFVYTGEPVAYELEAVIGIQRDDFEFQIQEYAKHGVLEAILSKKAH